MSSLKVSSVYTFKAIFVDSYKVWTDTKGKGKVKKC